MTKVLAAALLLALGGTGLALAQDAQPKEKQVGPREIDFTPMAKEDIGSGRIELRLIAAAEDGEKFDQTYVVGGLSRAQVRGLLSRQLKSVGWDGEEDGPDKVIVKGHKEKGATSLEITLSGLPAGNKPTVKPVEKK